MLQIVSLNPLHQFECDNIYKCLQFRFDRKSKCDENFGLFDIDSEYFIIDYEDLSFESIKARELRDYFIKYPDFCKKFLFSFDYFSHVFSHIRFNYLFFKTYFDKRLDYQSSDFICPNFLAKARDNYFLFEVGEFGLGITFTNNGFLCMNKEYLRLPLIRWNYLWFYLCNVVKYTTRGYLLNVLILIDDTLSYNGVILVDLDKLVYRLHSELGELEGNLCLVKDIKLVLCKSLFLLG